MLLRGKRRIWAVVAVSLLLVLAGCSGGNGGGTPTATAGDGNGQSATPGSNGSGVDIPGYDWAEGESYTYSLSGQPDLSFEWTVQSVRDGRVTAAVRRSGDTTTITGPQGDLLATNSDDSSTVAFLLLRYPQVLVADRDLRVGNGWSYSVASYYFDRGDRPTPRTGTVEITDTARVAGQECYELRIEQGGSGEPLSACVAEGWPFALSFQVSSQGQGITYSLESATRP